MNVTAKRVHATFDKLVADGTIPENWKEFITPLEEPGNVAIVHSLTSDDEYRVEIEKLTATTMDVSCKCGAGLGGHLCKHVAMYYALLREKAAQQKPPTLEKKVEEDQPRAPATARTPEPISEPQHEPAIELDQKTKSVMTELQKPFSLYDIEWRISRAGTKNGKPWAMVLAYITARAVHQRLDDIFGVGGWRNEFRQFTTGATSGIICRLWFRDPATGEWVWRENGAPETDVESFKGALSSAEKRAFAELGGGRYLYRLTENFAETSLVKSDATPNYAKTKDGQVFYWAPPEMPTWALP